jgi:hypothetical protein
MRKVGLSILVSVVIGLAGIFAASASPVSGNDVGHVTARTSGLERIQYRGYCDYLRRACEYKRELGEVGQGNCRKYREECGRRPSYCERLRRACEYKYERGEVGQGNCRRYREECGRSY